MELISFLVALCVLLSSFSAFQLAAYVRLKREHAATAEELRKARESPPPTPKLDVTAEDLLHDMTRRGAAILRVEVIDPNAILLRSPRG